ncbi:MAG TPA: ABC transporter permease [Vicinamibacterales bacterium]|jgi:putative ABC transport system permease protein|nr:ABC transporter permease [Vicinamibacterales bacterium]
MTLAQTVRIGARRPLKTPLFTVAVLGTLTLGIAANVIVFSTVNEVLLRPLPMSRPDDVVVIAETALGGRQGSKEVSYRDYLDWREQSRSFESMAVVSSTNSDFITDVGGQVVRFSGALVSASFFEVLGARPAMGRVFGAQEGRPGAARVLVISDGLWRRRFGGDPGVLGASLTIRGQSFTILGVMPREFVYPVGADVWTPVVPSLIEIGARYKVDATQARHFGLHTVLGRLRPGVTIEQARSELDLIIHRLPETQHPTGPAAIVTGLLDEIYGTTRRGVLLLFAMVALVMLTACANVASLVIARATALNGTFAVKSALGASRTQLTIEWLIEIGIVTVAASVAGVLVGWLALRPALRLAPASLPRLDNVQVDGTVLGFAVALCMFVTLFCAILPAIRSSRRVALAAVWRDRSDRVPASHGVGGVLTVLQVALATMILVSAGLLVRSFDRLQHVNLGFDPSRVLTLNVEPQVQTELQYRQRYDAMIRRISKLPGVEAVGASYVAPFARGRFGIDSGYLLEGQRIDHPDEWKNNTTLNFLAVTPGYFEAMRIPLRAGRFFTGADSDQAPTVAIVSESTGRRLWPNQSPIGKRISIASSVTASGDYPMQMIVGVVPDVPYRGISERHLDIYMPATQTQHRVAYLVVRTTGDPLAVARSVGSVVRDVAPSTIVERVTTSEALVSEAFAPIRFTMALLIALAVLGTVVAAAGLYALTAYSVSQRTQDLALRMAVGASSGAIVRMMLWQTGKFGAVGLAAGLVLSVTLATRITPLLFEVPALDVPAYAATTALLGAMVCLATYLAARRVTRIDPHLTMRTP